jgi:3-hydroxyisobutyrate dehydrogenase-like beta-hydroxyacid dehydrogenase
VSQARDGSLLAFAGARPEALERARPFLTAVSRAIYAVGPVGSGSAMKLVANMLLARFVEALAETLPLLDRFGIDRDLFFEAIAQSSLASPIWEKEHALRSGSPPVGFSLEHMAKDLRLLDEEIDRFGLSLPAHEAVHAIYQEALAQGFGSRCYPRATTPGRGSRAAHAEDRRRRSRRRGRARPPSDGTAAAARSDVAPRDAWPATRRVRAPTLR